MEHGINSEHIFRMALRIQESWKTDRVEFRARG
jgi:hypothetical protein